MLKNKKSICILLSLLLSYSLTACANKKNDKNIDSREYKYCIVKNEDLLATEKITANDITEILNVSRGYINAWNQHNINFMNKVFDDNINNIGKEKMIKMYKKEPLKSYKKKLIIDVNLINYNKDTAKVEVKYFNKKKHSSLEYTESEETVTLILNKVNNLWKITELIEIER